MPNENYISVEQAVKLFGKNKGTIQHYCRTKWAQETIDGQPVAYQEGKRKTAPWRIMQQAVEDQFGPPRNLEPPAGFLESKAMDALIDQLKASTDEIKALHGQMAVKDEQLASKDKQIHGLQVIVAKHTGIDVNRLGSGELESVKPSKSLWQRIRGR